MPETIVNPFSTFTPEEAACQVGMGIPTQHVQQNRLLYDGDHWQDGTGWMGPIPAATDRTYTDMKEEIRRVFCSRNVVKEIVDRKVDSLLKQTPTRTFTPRNSTSTGAYPPKLAALVQEAGNLSTGWWERNRIIQVLKEAYGRSQLGERVVVRLYVPRGLLQKDGAGIPRIPGGSIEDCMSLIYVEVAEPGSAGVGRDKDTKLQGAVYQVVDGTVQYMEIVFVQDGQTVVRTVEGNIDQPQDQEVDPNPDKVMPLGGRLTMYEPRLHSLISQQVRENQAAINLAKTMQNRNTITAGFLERVLFDAMPPGRWVNNPDKPGEEMYEVGPFKVGAGTTNFFMAAEYRERAEDGTMKTRYGNPSIHYHEPSASSTFSESKRDCYRDILEEVSQSFILIEGDATASGLSRLTAMETFKASIGDDAGEINGLIVWLLETPLALAAHFAGKDGYFDEVKAQAECHINVGPPTAAESKSNADSVAAGLLSRHTAMSRDGISDPSSELDTIAREREVSYETLATKLGIIVQIVALGVGPKQAGMMVGLTDEQLRFLPEKAPAPSGAAPAAGG